MTIKPDLLREAHDLALTVAPELHASPLYVVDADTFRDLPLPGSDCLGYALTPGEITFTMKERLDWQGAGPVVALLDGTPDVVLQTMVHEVGHIVPAKRPVDTVTDFPDLDTPVVRMAQRQRQEAALKGSEPPPDDPGNGHGPTFIRNACHLYYRAVTHGWTQLPIDNLFGGSTWFASQPAHYLTALLPELAKLRTATFREIESTPPPTAFIKLWQSNLEFWRSFQ